MKKEDKINRIKEAVGTLTTPEKLETINNIPDYNTVNCQGFDAYELPDELKLLSMLNSLKIEPQYYRDEVETVKELRDLVEKVAMKDPYFVAQAICWSRNIGEKMRTVSHIAASVLSPFISGKDYAKRFYGPFDRKTQSGGCIYRTDDMSNIKDIYHSLTNSPLSSAMKKGFKNALEKMDSYQLLKYKSTVKDIANLVHPDSSKSDAIVNITESDGTVVKMKTLDAILQNYSVTADTWESSNSEAGQIVADAVKDGKLDEEAAKIVLNEAKNDNWESLLNDNRLGILAALRNIRSMLKDPRESVIVKLCELLSDGDKIRKSGVMPYQIDIAYEILRNEFYSIEDKNKYYDMLEKALLDGYTKSIPNLSESMSGKTLIMVDVSGSMTSKCQYNKNKKMGARCIDKASLIAATIQKGTSADIVLFGTYAQWYHPVDGNVFQISNDIKNYNFGSTNLSSAFDLITQDNKKYDRIIILSDYECNIGDVKKSYGEYIRRVCNPYIYTVDLAVYGSAPISSDKVHNYFGYGYSFLDDISSKEFDPERAFEKVRNYKI